MPPSRSTPTDRGHQQEPSNPTHAAVLTDQNRVEVDKDVSGSLKDAILGATSALATEHGFQTSTNAQNLEKFLLRRLKARLTQNTAQLISKRNQDRLKTSGSLTRGEHREKRRCLTRVGWQEAITSRCSMQVLTQPQSMPSKVILDRRCCQNDQLAPCGNEEARSTRVGNSPPLTVAGTSIVSAQSTASSTRPAFPKTLSSLQLKTDNTIIL
mmetsp:Transcript_95182/g.132262  ORF Transcript_95182/g.132262 Transcript_95182/m.132262 type:complete len:212 (+) Transcript_95182:48-683(+)